MRERLLHIFEERIYSDSFKDLSGWDRPTTGPLYEHPITLEFSATELQRYVYDREIPNASLEESKDSIAKFIGIRERTCLGPENLLLTPGATAALAVVIYFLRGRGIDLLITDPPFYFSTKKICDSLGIAFIAIPRSLDDLDEHDRFVAALTKYQGRRKAVLVTNPRYVLSRNYPLTVLERIKDQIESEDILILDQSVDMEFINTENLRGVEPSVIKIRTLGKALSLNGSRLAAVVASEENIRQLNQYAGMLYGSLDVAMLQLGTFLVRSPDLFRTQLLAVRKIVGERFLEARTILADCEIHLPKPQNGFLGYLVVDTARIGRFVLYQGLLRERVHAMFSEHFGLRPIYGQELIRVNYLLDVAAALKILRGLLRQSYSG